MIELNFEEISAVNGGTSVLPGSGGQIDWWALDQFNREKMEEFIRRMQRNTTPRF
jgi:hypothetical protein